MLIVFSSRAMSETSLKHKIALSLIPGIGDINARRGEIQAVSPKGNISEIKARVPLKALFGYSTDLRSATQGRAVFSMQFFRFDKV